LVFADAEADGKNPRMIVDIPWGEVKQFFETESRRLAKEKLRV